VDWTDLTPDRGHKLCFQ